MLDARRRKRELQCERIPPGSGPTRALAPPLQRAMPDPLDLALELRDGEGVGRHAVVSVVAHHDLAEPGVLLHDRVMPTNTAFFPEAGELRLPLLPRGPTMEQRSPSSASADVVNEPQKLERLRLSLPSTFSSFGSKTPELQHPGLFRMQLQLEERKAFSQSFPHCARVLLALKAHHESSSPGELHPQALREPDVRLSPHPAPTTQPQAGCRVATGR